MKIRKFEIYVTIKGKLGQKYISIWVVWWLNTSDSPVYPTRVGFFENDVFHISAYLD